VGDATDKSKVPKSQEEVVPKALQDRAVSLEGPQGQSADPKDPEDQEDAEVAYTSLLSEKVPSSSREGWPRSPEEKAEALCVNVSLLAGLFAP
jgi:hypothetical protein